MISHLLTYLSPTYSSPIYTSFTYRKVTKGTQIRFLRYGLLIVLLLAAAACGAPRTEQSMEVAAMRAPAAEMAGANMDSGAETSAGAMGEDATVATANDSFQDGVPLARKIVARATMTLVVEDTDAIVNTLQQKLDAIGGYVAQANLYRNSYGGDERLQGTMTVRVPAASLEALMAELEQMAVDVQNKTISREDITDQYSDAEARLRNLEATEVELREMLAEVRAKPNAKPDDILTVYQHLTDIRGQIEQVQGRKNMYDNLVGLSTLELTLTPNWTTIPVIEEGWQPAQTLRNASRELVSALQDLADGAIWLIVFLLPILILIFIPLTIIFLLLRAGVRRLRGRKALRSATEKSSDNG